MVRGNYQYHQYNGSFSFQISSCDHLLNLKDNFLDSILVSLRFPFPLAFLPLNVIE